MNISGNNVDELIADATSKGMYVVDDKAQDALFDEFDSVLEEVNTLCDAVDAVETPFKSKYDARKMLDTLVNKFDANKSIALLEKQTAKITKLNMYIGYIRTRLGIICWEVEEPHNAQVELDIAAEYYAPAFLDELTTLLAKSGGDDGDEKEEKEEEQVRELKEGEDIDTPEIPADELVPPLVKLPRKDVRVDAMKCLNMLGILWSGRGSLRKAIVYLKAAKLLYEVSEEEKKQFSKKHFFLNADIESVHTHNLYYLAQVYGHLGDATLSAQYCRETLNRQYLRGMSDVDQVLDWVKNCMGISDFYLVTTQLKKSMLALLSAEKVFFESVVLKGAKEKMKTDMKNGDSIKDETLFERLVEMESDLHRRLAAVDTSILKRAYERQLTLTNAREMGVDLDDGDFEEVEGDDDNGAAVAATGLAKAGEKEAEATVFMRIASTELFEGIVVEQRPYLCLFDINSFDEARCVFLRANKHLDAAKKHFVLDGYVTDHVQILQAQSRLYHYLAQFEGDQKRRLAMEGRRQSMLSPLIEQLNRISYEGLHKEVSYELGEICFTQLETKLNKLKEKSVTGMVDGRYLKKAEVSNCNEFSRKALAYFSHYTSFYTRKGNANSSVTDKTRPVYDKMKLSELAYAACIDPDEASIGEQEVRSFLNAHFYCSRVLTKILMSTDTPQQETTVYLIAAMKRFEYIANYAPTLMENKGVETSIFGEELNLCKEMAELLPQKMDRVCYMKETPTIL